MFELLCHDYMLGCFYSEIFVMVVQQLITILPVNKIWILQGYASNVVTLLWNIFSVDGVPNNRHLVAEMTQMLHSAHFSLIMRPEKFTALHLIFPLHWHKETQSATYHTVYVDCAHSECIYKVHCSSMLMEHRLNLAWLRPDGIYLSPKQSTNKCLVLATLLK